MLRGSESSFCKSGIPRENNKITEQVKKIENEMETKRH